MSMGIGGYGPYSGRVLRETGDYFKDDLFTQLGKVSDPAQKNKILKQKTQELKNRRVHIGHLQKFGNEARRALASSRELERARQDVEREAIGSPLFYMMSDAYGAPSLTLHGLLAPKDMMSDLHGETKPADAPSSSDAMRHAPAAKPEQAGAAADKSAGGYESAPAAKPVSEKADEDKDILSALGVKGQDYQIIPFSARHFVS